MTGIHFHVFLTVLVLFPLIIHKMNDPGCLFIVQDITKKSKFEMPAGFFLIT